MTPTRTQWIALVAAVSFLVGAAGFFLGVQLADTKAPSADSVDVGFLQDMSAHHEQAIQMSQLELNLGAERDVKSFAMEIHRQQSYEIGAMARQLEAWGYAMAETPHAMAGMASDAEMDALGNARGRDADALFVRLMQDHHRGGVEMAELAAKTASDAFVRDIAARMASVQRTEIRELEGALKRAALGPTPAGWTPGPFGANHHEK